MASSAKLLWFQNTLSTEYMRYGILFLRGEWKSGLHGPIGYPVPGYPKTIGCEVKHNANTSYYCG